MKYHTRVVAFIASDEICGLTADLAKSSNKAFIRLRSQSDLLGFALNSDDILVIDTGKDVASLVHCVWSIRIAQNQQGRTMIIAIVNAAIVQDNPSLNMWLICGNNALDGLLDPDNPEFATFVGNAIDDDL